MTFHLAAGTSLGTGFWMKNKSQKNRNPSKNQGFGEGLKSKKRNGLGLRESQARPMLPRVTDLRPGLVSGWCWPLGGVPNVDRRGAFPTQKGERGLRKGRGFFIKMNG
jgi:hypothetical protein